MKILMVCLGNICRSPMAESIMRDMCQKKGLDWIIDSCGIGSWHIGNKPERRTISTLKKHDITTTHLGRQLTARDFDEFDYIFCMDDQNISDANEIKGSGECKAKLELLVNYDPLGSKDIPDPYYSDGDKAFDEVFSIAERCCAEFIRKHADNCV